MVERTEDPISHHNRKKLQHSENHGLFPVIITEKKAVIDKVESIIN